MQFVANSWGMTADLRAQAMRSKGFLVLKVDNRGSNRSSDEMAPGIFESICKILTIKMSPHASFVPGCFSGRGLYFEAPVKFDMGNIEVEDQAGPYSIAVGLNACW